MKLKLDENLGIRGASRLREAGHQVATVADEQLMGASDDELIARCRSEGRALVSLDLDFSNPLRYDPAQHAGVAVLRLPGRAGPDVLADGIETLIQGLDRMDLAGRIWIVQGGRIRVYQPA